MYEAMEARIKDRIVVCRQDGNGDDEGGSGDVGGR